MLVVAQETSGARSRGSLKSLRSKGTATIVTRIRGDTSSSDVLSIIIGRQFAAQLLEVVGITTWPHLVATASSAHHLIRLDGLPFYVEIIRGTAIEATGLAGIREGPFELHGSIGEATLLVLITRTTAIGAHRGLPVTGALLSGLLTKVGDPPGVMLL